MTEFFDFSFWQSFASEFLATLIGAGLGVGGAIWLSRRQDKSKELRERQEEFERKRKILLLIRTELFDSHIHIADELSHSLGHKEIAFVGTELKVEAWKALSDGGELQWIKEPQLLGDIAWTYSKIGYIKFLSEKLIDLVMFSTESDIPNVEKLIGELLGAFDNVQPLILNAVREIDHELPGIEY